MRKIKKISLSALSLSLFVALASCSKGTATTTTTAELPTTTVTPTTTEPTKEVDYPDMVIDTVETTDYKTRFSSIAIDTTNAKTLYYMGESFNPEGIEVTGYFVQTYSDGTTKSVTKKMSNVSYNLDNVDFNKAGTYKVLVQARDNATVQERTFDINVQSSVLAESGQLYIGGLEITYDSKFQTNLILGNTFTYDKTKVLARLVFCKNGEVDHKEYIDVDKLTVDTNSLTNENLPVGTYQIKYSYSGDKITYKGKEYANDVSTYTIVSVTNDITKIEYLSGGGTVFYASTAGIDLSSWVVKITRENGKTEKKRCTTDLFTVSNLNSYVVSLEQNIRISSKENPACYFDKAVEIRESQTQNIVIASALSYMTKNAAGELVASEDQTVTDANKDKLVSITHAKYGKLYQLGSYTNTVDGEKVAMIYGNPTKVTGDSASSSDGISFSNRPSIKASSQPIIVNMKKSGTLIVYISPSSEGAERTLNVYDPNGEELETYTTGTETKVAVGYRMEITEPGEYTFISPDMLYLWGFVIATDKD